MSAKSLHVSPESVGVKPGPPVSDPQQEPRVGCLNTALGRQASGAAVISNEEAPEVTAHDDRERLCLTEVPAWRVSRPGELITQHVDVLVLGIGRKERIAEDLAGAVQRG